MFTEIAFAVSLLALITLVIGILIDKELIRYLAGILFVVGIICFIVALTIPWQHETKAITIMDKFTTGGVMYVVGDDGIAYTIRSRDPGVYSRLRINTTYTMSVAHNFEGEGVLGLLATHNIDKVNW